MKKLLHSPVLCPVCATAREITRVARPAARCFAISGVWGIMAGGLIAMIFGAAWGGWTCFVVSVLCFLILEVYYNAKLKQELVCPVCHFDPILYRRAPESAMAKCKEGLKQKEALFLAKWRLMNEGLPQEGN